MSESFTSVDLLAIRLRAEAGSDVPALLATITALLAALEPFAHEEFCALGPRNWEEARAILRTARPCAPAPY